MRTKRIALLGAGGHAKVVWDTLRLMRTSEPFEVVAVLDDAPKTWGRQFMGIPVQGPICAITRVQVDGAVIGIGDNNDRSKVYEGLKALGVPLINVIHPSAVVTEDVQLGDGIVAFANVVVNIGTRVGDNVILNTSCTVDHDCIIGAHSHLGPGVHLSGGVNVGEGTLMGIASAAIPGITIGNWATVGAGSVVIENIPDRATAVGVPAHILRRGNQYGV